MKYIDIKKKSDQIEIYSLNHILIFYLFICLFAFYVGQNLYPARLIF